MYTTETLPAYLFGLTTCLSTTGSVPVTETLPNFQNATFHPLPSVITYLKVITKIALAKPERQYDHHTH